MAYHRHNKVGSNICRLLIITFHGHETIPASAQQLSAFALRMTTTNSQSKNQAIVKGVTMIY